MGAEAQFRRVIEAAPDGIVVTRDGMVLFANPAAVVLLGYDAPSELVGQPMARFLDPAELATMRERVALMREGKKLAPYEYAARRRDGARVTAEITSLSIEWDGAPAVIALVRDVTERARLQAQLAHVDRLAALGTLAAGLAHEVNNPLAYMALRLESLEKLVGASIEDGARRADALRAIADLRGGAERVSAIVRDLRTFALDGAREQETASADLSAVLGAVERLVAHDVRHRATLSTTHGPALPRVRGSAHRLEQVFVNLILNAAHAASDGPVVARIAVRAFAEAACVTVEVTDNGPGIADDVLGRIFDPFFTTKPAEHGMGLGLAICHRIVSQLGGAIAVESKLGQGTTFRVSLPVAPPDAAPPHVTAARPAPASDRWRVLVIDDEPAIGRLLANLLGHHEVEVVSSGERGLARLREGDAYDVVVCDLMMPLVTGMEVYTQIAAARPGIEQRFVFITGGAFTAAASAFLAAIPNRRLDKPFAMQDLEAAMSETVAATRAATHG